MKGLISTAKLGYLSPEMEIDLTVDFSGVDVSFSWLDFKNASSKSVFMADKEINLDNGIKSISSILPF